MLGLDLNKIIFCRQQFKASRSLQNTAAEADVTCIRWLSDQENIAHSFSAS